MNSGVVHPERPRDRLVKWRVREVILPPDHMRDAEISIVDDRREVISRRAVRADQRRPPLFAKPERAFLLVRRPALEEPRRGLAIAVAALTLANRALVPPDPEPGQIGEDPGFRLGVGSRRIGVVDPQDQHPAALVREAAIRDGRQCAPEVKRPGRARREADSGQGEIPEIALPSSSPTPGGYAPIPCQRIMPTRSTWTTAISSVPERPNARTTDPTSVYAASALASRGPGSLRPIPPWMKPRTGVRRRPIVDTA